MVKTCSSPFRKLATIAGAASALILSSCTLPREAAWSKVRHEGPVSYVAYEVGSQLDSRSRAFPQNAPSTRGVDFLGAGRTLTAKWAPGVPGYVRSPYTYPPRLVDVGGALPGTVSYCPYSQKPFVVPYYPAAVSSVQTQYRREVIADKEPRSIY